jgi:hypothetical protein
MPFAELAVGPGHEKFWSGSRRRTLRRLARRRHLTERRLDRTPSPRLLIEAVGGLHGSGLAATHVCGDLIERLREDRAQFIAGGQSELGERGVKVAFNRPHRERESAGDFRIRRSLRRQ